MNKVATLLDLYFVGIDDAIDYGRRIDSGIVVNAERVILSGPRPTVGDFIADSLHEDFEDEN
jgi:hypothetical protein